jgi:hypothetical protein
MGISPGLERHKRNIDQNVNLWCDLYQQDSSSTTIFAPNKVEDIIQRHYRKQHKSQHNKLGVYESVVTNFLIVVVSVLIFVSASIKATIKHNLKVVVMAYHFL